MMVTDALNRGVRLTEFDPGTWCYAYSIKPGKSVRAWRTHNKRKHRTTTHIRYIKDVTTPAELQAAIDKGLAPGR